MCSSDLLMMVLTMLRLLMAGNPAAGQQSSLAGRAGAGVLAGAVRHAPEPSPCMAHTHARETRCCFSRIVYVHARRATKGCLVGRGDQVLSAISPPPPLAHFVVHSRRVKPSSCVAWKAQRPPSLPSLLDQLAITRPFMLGVPPFIPAPRSLPPHTRFQYQPPPSPRPFLSPFPLPHPSNLQILLLAAFLVTVRPVRARLLHLCLNSHLDPPPVLNLPPAPSLHPFPTILRTICAHFHLLPPSSAPSFHSSHDPSSPPPSIPPPCALVLPPPAPKSCTLKQPCPRGMRSASAPSPSKPCPSSPILSSSRLCAPPLPSWRRR